MNSGLMPAPLSRTVMATLASLRVSKISTRPSRGVNLIAFDSKFHTTCCRRAGSPAIMPGAST
jgi:hypothetical protein